MAAPAVLVGEGGALSSSRHLEYRAETSETQWKDAGNPQGPGFHGTNARRQRRQRGTPGRPRVISYLTSRPCAPVRLRMKDLNLSTTLVLAGSQRGATPGSEAGTPTPVTIRQCTRLSPITRLQQITSGMHAAIACGSLTRASEQAAHVWRLTPARLHPHPLLAAPTSPALHLQVQAQLAAPFCWLGKRCSCSRPMSRAGAQNGPEVLPRPPLQLGVPLDQYKSLLDVHVAFCRAHNKNAT